MEAITLQASTACYASLMQKPFLWDEDNASERTLGAMLFASIGVIIALVVIQICFHVVLGAVGAREAGVPADERDHLILGRAARISHLVNYGAQLYFYRRGISQP